MADPSGVHYRRPDVVDQLFLNELPAVVDAVEDLPDRQRRRRVLPDQPEALGVLRDSWILEPEQPMRLGIMAQTGGFDWPQAVMHVVQQVHVEAELTPKALEQRCHAAQITLAAPRRLGDRSPLGRFVGHAG